MLPPDGTGHTQALFITVMCRNMVVARVLIDNGSALNVRPLITLQKLGVEESQIQPNNMTIRAFDGSKKKAIGEIDLAVESGNPPELARRRRKADSIRLAEWKALDSPAYSPSDSNRRIDPLTEFPLAEPGDSVASSSLVRDSSDPCRVGQRTLPADTGRCVRGCLGNIHPR